MPDGISTRLEEEATYILAEPAHEDHIPPWQLAFLAPRYRADTHSPHIASHSNISMEDHSTPWEGEKPTPPAQGAKAPSQKESCHVFDGRFLKRSLPLCGGPRVCT